MIKNLQPLSMAESLEYAKDSETGDTDVVGFIKKFTGLKPEKAKEMRGKIEDLKLLKVKSEHVAKIIDLMPEDSQDLNQIFVDVSLDEDETKKILDIVKEYK